MDIKNLQIIDGLFLPERSREVLLDLVNSKIDFHKRNKYKGDVLFSEERISELEKIIDVIEITVDNAIKNKKKIIMQGYISLKIID